MNLDAFEALAFHRRSVRNFKPDPISHALLERLIRITQRAPSSYNLQPVHYYIVRQQQIKEALVRPALGQKQVLSAPALVIFAADRDAAAHNFDKAWGTDLAQGAITEEKLDIGRNLVDLNFSIKPLGCGWITKCCIAPLIRLFTPIPELPAIHKRAWLQKNVGLAAMMFMLAAESAGLATCPMSGFDEHRLKKVVKIPRRFDVPLLIAVGYPAERPPERSRLPLEEVVHWL
jgi:nitroreductase